MSKTIQIKNLSAIESKRQIPLLLLALFACVILHECLSKTCFVSIYDTHESKMKKLNKRGLHSEIGLYSGLRDTQACFCLLVPYDWNVSAVHCPPGLVAVI